MRKKTSRLPWQNRFSVQKNSTFEGMVFLITKQMRGEIV